MSVQWGLTVWWFSLYYRCSWVYHSSNRFLLSVISTGKFALSFTVFLKISIFFFSLGWCEYYSRNSCIRRCRYKSFLIFHTKNLTYEKYDKWTARQLVFFSKSVKKSVKGGIRVFVREPHTPIGRVRRGKKYRPSPVQPRSRPFVWLLARTWIRKNIRTVLQSIWQTTNKYYFFVNTKYMCRC